PMRCRYGVVASIAALALANQRQVHAGNGTMAGASAAAARCAATPIRTTHFPERGLGPLPWIVASPASAGITGHLFYAYGLHGKAAELHIHGMMPHGRSTKILWVIKNDGAGRTLNIAGRNLTGGGTTHQRFPAATSPIGDYPSILDVPTPGCWQFRLTSATVQGTVTLRAIK
ncbi:MAG: hypothetical protein ACRDG4_05490, partial [Chloroflexota bacterium]